MDINLTVESTDHVRIFINGKLAGEVSVKELTSFNDLKSEVEKARKLNAVPMIVKNAINKIFKLRSIEDHVNIGEKARQTAFADGLIDGLQQLRIPHPMGNVPSILPRSDQAYTIGYEYGQVLSQLVDELS